MWLSEDACRHILLKLDNMAIASVMRADRRWNRLANDPIVWWHRCQEFEDSEFDASQQWKPRTLMLADLKPTIDRLVRMGKRLVKYAKHRSDKLLMVSFSIDGRIIKYNFRKDPAEEERDEITMINVLLDETTMIFIYPNDLDDVGHIVLNDADIIRFDDTKAFHSFWNGNPALLDEVKRFVQCDTYCIEDRTPNENCWLISRSE